MSTNDKSGESSTVNPKKPPKPFRRPLKPKKYRNKLAGRIFLEPDRAFLKEITTTDDDGRVVLARDLSKEELSKLKKLTKAAKKNKRGPRVFRLAILAVFVGAVIVFNIVFKDRLVRDGAETLLEGLFEAQADLEGVRFRPIRGKISFERLAVADADSPMNNLFELSSGVIAVDTWQLLNRRIQIDQISVQGLEFSTTREASGALESVTSPDEGGEGSAVARESAGGGAAALVDRVTDVLPEISFESLGLPDTLDAERFIEENLAFLETPVAVETLSGTALSFVDRWTGEVDSLADELAGIVEDVTNLANTDFRSIRSVDAAMAAYDDASDLQANVTGITNLIEGQYNTLVAEATDILETARNLPAQATEDYQALLALIPDIRGGGRDFVVALVTPYVQEALGDWYDRIGRGLDVYERLTAEVAARAPARQRRVGTDFDFSAVERPRFLLSLAQLGIGATGDETLSVNLSSLSSDPDLVSEPAQIVYNQRGSAGVIGIEATLDGRTDADTVFDVGVATADTPLSVTRGLDTLAIDNVSGRLSVDSRLVKLSSGAIDGTVGLDAINLAVAGSYASDSLGEFVADLFTRAESLTGEFAFTMVDRSNVTFTRAETNLDEVVAGAVRERIDAAVATFRTELEASVTAYLDPLIASLNDSLNGIVEVETSAEELLALAKDREAAAAELQRLAGDSINSYRDQLEAEAQAALDAARAEAEARAQAARDAAQAEAERAAEEAEAAARAAAEEAAENAVDSIRDALPFGRRR